ncbi:MAG TPA: carboxypeptidase regulatory-like domain-containing protein [Bryobacteraceae bacterium]|nr:carboxypeptidase regulatory-like domain-containing protein [Bryobacteraceae bacterium]
MSFPGLGSRNRATWVLAWLAVFTLAAAEHHGRVEFGGLPVPGASVTATRGDLKVTAVTDADGRYSFLDLQDGLWTIDVAMQCFAPLHREVQVAPNAPSPTWDLTLLPWKQIAGSVPATTVLTPPTAASNNNNKTEAKTKQAPAFKRTDLAPTSGAAKLEAESTTSEFGKKADDGFLVNGSVNNGAASPFSQSPAFGNFRRGGRSLYNGGLGVILGNSALNARAFSLTGQNTPQPAYNHIQGVASFGGPLRIPHILTGRVPNVTLNYQWMRNRNATTQTALVPTAAERTGNLSQSATVLDPANGAPFAGNVIPQSRISPQAQALLNLYPLPNFAGTRYNYQVPLVGVTNQDALQMRFSQYINSKNQLSGSLAWQRTDNRSPNLFEFVDTSNLSGINTAVNWSHGITRWMLLRLGYEFSRSAARTNPYFANRENVSGDAGITGNNQEPLNWGPPQLSFSSGIAGLSDAIASFNRNQTSAVTAAVTWNHRDHNMTFGSDYRRQQFNYLSQQNPRGAFTFTGAAAGSDFGGFLLGIPDTSSIAFGNADKYFRESVYDAYFNDDWRLSPGFTVNAGLRWDYSAPITELFGRLVNLDIAPGFVAEAPVIAATPTGSVTGRVYPDSLIHPDKHALEPRLGIAWRPFLASSLVVRAGYGVSYDTSVYQTIAVRMAQQSPLSKSLSVPNSAADPLTLANGFNASPSVTPNTFAINPDFRIGYAQTWQASVQRDLPGGLVALVTYLGIKGTRAVQEFLPNTYPAGAVNPCPLCPAGYVFMTSNGNSTRESGSVQLRRRLRHGFTATVQYTYSKSIDDAALGGKNQGTAVIAQDWLNLSAERGLSPFDQRHLLNVQFQYTTGIGVRGGTLLSGWRGQLFKGWTFAGEITKGTGFPLTPIYIAAVRGTGVTGSIRPNYTGASVTAAPSGLFLNPAAYEPPSQGEWGNAGRNSITGPGQFGLNASLDRSFRLRDRLNADLRFDATNLLNHVTYPNWNTIVGNAQFGLPTTANAMRTVRAAMRLRF